MSALWHRRLRGTPVCIENGSRHHLVADDGTVLMDTKVTTFPVATNINGIASSGGTLTMTYQVTSASTTTEGDVVVPGTTENKTFTRRVEFVKE
ncbi:MAG: hypothetical protein ACLS5C_02525 [Waltera sp.]